MDFAHAAVSDIRIKGTCSGFPPDMSTGLTFGLKLANGDYSCPHFDADTQISNGSAEPLFTNGLGNQPFDNEL